MKKLSCLFLAFTLVFTLCACGKDNASDTENSAEADGSQVIEKSFNGYKTGGYYTLGVYEQDNDTSNGAEEIEWLILDIQGSKALVVSRYVLDSRRYNSKCCEMTWEDCTLRQWLNDDFLNSAFTADEQQRIQTTTVVAEDNKNYETDAGNDTQDKIFLLSYSEAWDYFDSNAPCRATDYAVAEGCYISTSADDDYGNCYWWLRTPGQYQDFAALVDYSGYIDNSGLSVNYDKRGVRPAMWIELG